VPQSAGNNFHVLGFFEALQGGKFPSPFHRASRLQPRCARLRREEARRSTQDRERRRQAEGFGTLGHKVLGRRRAMKDHSVDCYFQKEKSFIFEKFRWREVDRSPRPSSRPMRGGKKLSAILY
jgi:hypothetical protein